MGGQVSSCSCCTASSRATRGKGLRAQLCNAIDRSSKASKQKSAELRLQERVSLPVRQNGQNHQNAKLRRLILGGIKTDYFQRPKAHWSDGQNHLDHSNHCYCQRCPMEPHVVAKFLSRILVQNSSELQPDVSLMLGDDATHECQHSEKSKR